ncbi:MAG TPA: hypothetical protein VKI00_09400 [Mycobacterium sp.]|uniref:hypothetical protein n=1 Tax=Mycobacterium sp. TaxID=1785 RepID=UPI002B75A2E8|nr:hypothetical protein [Mycobacterium sp.]HME75847.1 hypothetical protein [Mycobacterium sp.]
MSEQLTDPVDDGQAWARRQQEAFPECVIRYGMGDPGLRDDSGLPALIIQGQPPGAPIPRQVCPPIAFMCP